MINAAAGAGRHLPGRPRGHRHGLQHRPLPARRSRPPPGSTPHAGVTVRYLAAQPPLDPVAGRLERDRVTSTRASSRYRWALRRVGRASRSLAHGAGHELQRCTLPVPAVRPGLYELALRSGPHRTIVPLVASIAGRPAAAVLVVLPALTWQGLNPVDDDGDGLPNTLTSRRPDRARSARSRTGCPAGFGDEAALLAYLDKAHRSYDLTTDLGAASTASGPLAQPATRGVVLAGQRALAAGIAAAARCAPTSRTAATCCRSGSTRCARTVTIARATRRVSTEHPPPRPTPLGARPGRVVVAQQRARDRVISDGLGIFSTTSGAFAGFRSYQPIRSVAAPGAARVRGRRRATDAPSDRRLPARARDSSSTSGCRASARACSRTTSTRRSSFGRGLWTVLVER